MVERYPRGALIINTTGVNMNDAKESMNDESAAHNEENEEPDTLAQNCDEEANELLRAEDEEVA